MTVKQFAENRGVSKQFCYQQLKNAGKTISDYTDKTGNLSPEGIALLKELIPDKSKKTEIPVKKKSAYDELVEDNRELLKTVNKLTDSLTESNKRVGELTAALAQAQENLNQEQRLHGDLRLEYNALRKRLGAGEDVKEDPIQPEGESQEEKKEPETVKSDKPEKEPEKKQEPKKDPEKKDPEPEKPAEPGKPEGESPSPVTGSEKTKPEQKFSFRKRLQILFTGKESP